MSTIKRVFILLTLVFLALSCRKSEETSRVKDLSAVSWPVFRGDARLSGTASDSLPDQITLLWTFQTGDAVVSTPVIGSGRVAISSTDGKVYAIDLGDGVKIWEFDSGEDIEASPLLLNHTLYVGSLSGEFFALHAKTGQVRWKYKIDNSIYGSANWTLMPGGQDTLIFVGSYDAQMYCFEAGTGKLKWTYETNNYINGAPATDGKHVVFGGCDELLHIVSAADGSKTGDVWVKSYIAGSVAFVDERAYLGHYDNKLVCVDVASEKIVWEFEDDENRGAFFASPAVGKDHVVIGSRDRYVYCVDRNTGTKQWSFGTRNEIDSSPVIAGDKVVVGSTDGRLYVLDLESGQALWSYEIGAVIIGCPAVAGGMIVIGAEDGRVYAFGEKQ